MVLRYDSVKNNVVSLKATRIRELPFILYKKCIDNNVHGEGEVVLHEKIEHSFSTDDVDASVAELLGEDTVTVCAFTPSSKKEVKKINSFGG